MSHLPTPEFLREIADLAGTPPEILANAELMELFLPLLRADFRAAEEYRRPEGAPLEQPMFVYGGREDEDVPQDALEAWRLESRGPFSLRMFQGGHFFIQEQRDALLAALREDLHMLGGAFA